MAGRVVRQFQRQARFSRGTAAQWTSENPVLFLGEPGLETDTGRLKIGDGDTDWATLPYSFESGSGVTDHGLLTGLADDDHTQYTTTAEAQALVDVHTGDTGDAHDASAISILDAGGDFTATDVEGALDELQADNEAHVAAGDPHTGYRLESADHTHQSTGLQAGTLDHGAALTGLSDNDHPQYALEVKEEGVSEGTLVTALDFDGSDFNVAVDAAEADITLNYGSGSGQPAEGNHSHAGAGHVIKDAGSAETQRGNLDFQDGFIVSDNAGSDATEVDLDFGTGATQPAAGDHSHAGAGHTISEAGTPVTQRAELSFEAGFDVTDDAGNNETEISIDLSEVATFTDHSARHEDGGADEISIAGLSGDSAAVTALRAIDFLVGTATGELSGEIAVGTSPGGELGGTWASPTVDATHSGSAHHAQSHDHSAAGDGQTLTPATLNIPNAAAPTPTAEGQAAWDNDDNFLRIGDGAASKDFFPTVDATSDPVAVTTAAADGTEKTTARKDHAHAHEAAHINHDTTWAAKGDLIVATGNDAASVVTVGADDTILMADAAAGNGVKWSAAAAAAQIADIAEAESAGTSDTWARGDHVHSGNLYRLESESGTFTVGGVLLDPTAARTIPVWKAPFACTLTEYAVRVVGGTNAVTNAQRDDGTPADVLTGDLTTTPADGWETGTIAGAEDNFSAGDKLLLEVVSVSGAVTEVAWTLTFTRP
jgi:hypothetical protein